MPGIRGPYRYRTRCEVVYSPTLVIRPFRVTIALVALMTVLATGYSFVRHTSTHDWYAAGKYAISDFLIRAGYDWRAPMRYRTRDGLVVVTTHSRFRFNPEAILARGRIARTAAIAVEAGAICGLFSSLFFHFLLLGPGIERRKWDDEPGRKSAYRPDMRDRYPPSGTVLEIDPEEAVMDNTNLSMPPDPDSGMAHENTLPVRHPTHLMKHERPKGNWF